MSPALSKNTSSQELTDANDVVQITDKWHK